MLSEGQIIDRYEVVRLLGEGGLAQVYQVRHTQLHSDHALKVLTVSSPAIRSRLIAEGRAQAALRHPNAITVTDVIDVDGVPGLVMEYVPGGNLFDWIEAHSPSRATRMAVFRQVCAAVAEAHERGWVHRDLKPENVLVNTEGPEPEAKVADFGLVKAVIGDSLREGHHTRGGLPLGSPGFIAPEQIEDAAGVDARADVFSLGCLLVWLLTGRSPFEADTVIGSFARVAKGEHDSLGERDPLRLVADRALHTDPDARFADAGALLEALNAPTPSKRLVPSPQESPSPWLFPALGITGAAVFLVPLCLVLCLGFGLPRASAVKALVPSMDGTSSCRLGGDESLGYIRTNSAKIRRGSRRTLSSVTEVFENPGDTEPVCTLPENAVVTALESTRFRLKGSWMKVYGDAVELP